MAESGRSPRGRLGEPEPQGPVPVSGRSCGPAIDPSATSDPLNWPLQSCPTGLHRAARRTPRIGTKWAGGSGSSQSRNGTSYSASSAGITSATIRPSELSPSAEVALQIAHVVATHRQVVRQVVNALAQRPGPKHRLDRPRWPARLDDARAWCQQRVEAELAAGNRVVLSNVFNRREHMETYLKLTPDSAVIKMTVSYGSVHHVPPRTIEKFASEWDDYEGEIEMPAGVQERPTASAL